MTNELKTKWIDALRSGDYTQGHSKLKYEEKGVMKYCCLGVLCDVAGVESTGKTLGNIFSFYDLVGILSTRIRLNIGISDEIHNQAWHLNDDNRYTFTEIAEWLEKERGI